LNLCEMLVDFQLSQYHKIDFDVVHKVDKEGHYVYIIILI